MPPDPFPLKLGNRRATWRILSHPRILGFSPAAPSAPAGCLCPLCLPPSQARGRWALPGGLPLPFDSFKLFPPPLQWVLSFEIFIPLVLFFILLGLRQKKPTIAVKEGKRLAAGRNLVKLVSLPRWPQAQSPQVKPVASSNQASPGRRSRGMPCPAVSKLSLLRTKSVLSCLEAGAETPA